MVSGGGGCGFVVVVLTGCTLAAGSGAGYAFGCARPMTVDGAAERLGVEDDAPRAEEVWVEGLGLMGSGGRAAEVVVLETRVLGAAVIVAEGAGDTVSASTITGTLEAT